MRIDEATRARLARVSQAVRLPAAAVPVLLPSDSNDVWRIGPVVVRICWRGDRERFTREAAVTCALPAGVPYPEVLDSGSDGELSWQVTRLVDGAPLSTVWRDLSRAEQHDAVNQIGAALAALHAHRFPADVVAALAAPRPVGEMSTSALVGADITLLPVRRAQALLAIARRDGAADTALIDQVAARFHKLADADPLAAAGPFACVHGDAHLGNALWKDGRLTAVLDFEWVRLGPPDLEIEPYLREDVTGLTLIEVREVIGWLAESYPAMVAGPDLVRRLWLCQLANAVRELFLDDADRSPGSGPWRRLRRIVTSPDDLLQILPAAQ
ncbi:phosphotransferase family protein [Paractinoplanes maris]|uniref:phosphotransferase family protein n=1 Tax=Paractinoplanes maris TaxID=1734446 RepID=UPI002020BA36|nr:aminoglycoside phosphotransferase family protein [Actinoplanes maris]